MSDAFVKQSRLEGNTLTERETERTRQNIVVDS